MLGALVGPPKFDSDTLQNDTIPPGCWSLSDSVNTCLGTKASGPLQVLDFSMVDPVLSSKAKGLAASSTLLTVTVLFAGITGIGSEGTTLGVWLRKVWVMERVDGSLPSSEFYQGRPGHEVQV